MSLASHYDLKWFDFTLIGHANLYAWISRFFVRFTDDCPPVFSPKKSYAILITSINEVIGDISLFAWDFDLKAPSNIVSGRLRSHIMIRFNENEMVFEKPKWTDHVSMYKTCSRKKKIWFSVHNWIYPSMDSEQWKKCCPLLSAIVRHCPL